MNLFRREMKAYRKGLIIWCIGVFALIASSLSKLDTLSASDGALDELMSKMPKSLQAIFGIGELDLSTPIGYYGMIFIYIALMAGIHAVMLGSGMISKEERDKTSEFLIAKPISRNGVVTSKLLSALVQVAIFNIATMIYSIGLLKAYSDDGTIVRDVVLFMAALFMLQLIFLSIGTATAAAGRHPKSASAISASILLAAYLLSTATDLNEKLEFLRYVTPFAYYRADRLLAEGGLSPLSVILSLAIIAVLTGITYSCYRKRDLQA